MSVIGEGITTFKSTVTLGLVQKLVDTINNLLTSLLPNGEKALVVAFSLLFSLILKSRMREAGWVFVVLMTLVFYSFFRFWGIGEIG